MERAHLALLAARRAGARPRRSHADPPPLRADPPALRWGEWALQGASWGIAWVPWRWLRFFGAMLGWVAGCVLRIRRAHVEAALEASGIADAPREARGMYRSLGASAFELLWMAGRGPSAPLHASVDPGSRAALDAALAEGRGVVLAASHTGNWDLAACAIARDVPLLVVTKRLRVRALDAFWQSTRAAFGVSLADPVGALGRARAMVAAGGCAAMMIDQVPTSSRHAIRGEVLGRPAWIDRTPAVLAAATGAPLVVAASRRAPRGEHELFVLEVRWPPRRAGKAWVDEATRAASSALDAFVRAQPNQWLWLHRRWRDPRPRSPSRVLGEPPARASTPGAARLHSARHA